MATNREPCGCKHDGHKWLVMCPAHQVEHDETHQRWADEHFGRAQVIDEQCMGIKGDNASENPTRQSPRKSAPTLGGGSASEALSLFDEVAHG